MATASVIVCTYNRCQSLKETLQALSGQQLRNGLAMEILVVDNNSTDETRTVVQEASRGARWPIRYLFEPAQGTTYARNRGIQEAQGDLVAFVDDDVIPEPSWVAALEEAFETHRADCVGGKIIPLWASPPPRWLAQGRDHAKLWALLALLDLGPEPVVISSTNGHSLYGANLAFRKTVFADVGLFATHLGRRGSMLFSGEDTDILIRLLHADKCVVYAPTAIVHHRIGPERMRMGYFRRWKFHSGRQMSSLEGPARRPLAAWHVRECAQNGLSALWGRLRRDHDLWVERELLFWFQLGRLVG